MTLAEWGITTPAQPAHPHGWDGEVVGAESRVRLADGSERRFVNLDNAATTPALNAVQQAVLDFLPWYSSVHRGTGFKSRLSTSAFEEAREAIGATLGIDDARQSVIFVKSATEGLNKVAHALAGTGVTVFTTLMEHHANLLPWRLHASAVRYIHTDDDGVIDQDDLARQLRAVAGPKLLAISGAYNTTGYCPPIRRLAALAHEHGAAILVDGAQSVPHRALSVSGDVPGEEIDYLAFSAHKVYAPFGAGVLVAPRHAFQGVPDLLGGGAAARVTPDDVVWADWPDREEAGSPNVVGAVALAAALRRLETLGRAAIEQYEGDLTRYAVERLEAVPGLTLLGPREERTAILSFALAGIPHDLVAAILGYEHGIGVRAGLFCAHQGMQRLLHRVPVPTLHRVPTAQAPAGNIDQAAPPATGAVRASLGLYNTRGDIDALADALAAVAHGGGVDRFVRHQSGDYRPVGWQPEYDGAFSWLSASR